jgi:Superinfection immunity protein
MYCNHPTLIVQPVAGCPHADVCDSVLYTRLFFFGFVVAEQRKHNAVLNIMVINLWLGWTVIGWLATLIWACNWDVEGAAAWLHERPPGGAASGQRRAGLANG